MHPEKLPTGTVIKTREVIFFTLPFIIINIIFKYCIFIIKR